MLQVTPSISPLSLLSPHLPTPTTLLALAQLILLTYATLWLPLYCLQDLCNILSGWLRPSESPIPGDSAVETVIPNRTPATQATPLASCPPPLPLELVERIAYFLFEPAPPAPDGSAAVSLQSVKPLWGDVAGFMQASVGLHNIGFKRWLQVIAVKNVEDWSVINDNIRLIREIHCFDGTLLDSEHQNTLSKIPYLYTAIVDAHSDVWHDKHNRFAYRDILSTLPPSLKRLEIEHAHGPDIKIISLVKQHCPQLEELILGRCTMFNRHPACDFWVSFPHDHDAYMSDTGTDAYAHSLANELAPLKHLRSLRVGLYFAPSDIVLAHRLYHRRGLPAPETIHWQSAIPLAELPANTLLQELPPHIEPATTTQLVSLLHHPDEESYTEFKCSRCAEITYTASKEAEKSASSILHEYIPTLLSVEWMGWLTPRRLGIHSYRFSP